MFPDKVSGAGRAPSKASKSHEAGAVLVRSGELEPVTSGGGLPDAGDSDVVVSTVVVSTVVVALDSTLAVSGSHELQGASEGALKAVGGGSLGATWDDPAGATEVVLAGTEVVVPRPGDVGPTCGVVFAADDGGELSHARPPTNSAKQATNDHEHGGFTASTCSSNPRRSRGLAASQPPFLGYRILQSLRLRAAHPPP